MIEQVSKKLSALPGAEILAADVAKTGTHLDALVTPETIRDAAKILREAEFLIESVSGLDATPKMMVIYHFTRVDDFCRVALKTLVDRENKVSPTLEDIFPGANWHERETHDFFGIVFEGHPDMTPLILPEDAGDFHPLLKGEKGLKELGALMPRFPVEKVEKVEKPAKAEKPAKSEVEA